MQEEETAEKSGDASMKNMEDVCLAIGPLYFFFTAVILGSGLYLKNTISEAIGGGMLAVGGLCLANIIYYKVCQSVAPDDEALIGANLI